CPRSRSLSYRPSQPTTPHLVPYTTLFRSEFEPREQFEQRLKKIEQIRALGLDPYPREFRSTDTPAELVEKFSAATASELEANKRSEEHTSELQSPDHLVCRLLLEKNRART